MSSLNKLNGNTDTGNQLFPVFLKLNELQVLVVGAGKVGLEKLQAILGNSPETTIRLVSQQVCKEVIDYSAGFPNLSIRNKDFEESDLDGIDIAIIATNNSELNNIIRSKCRERRILVNVADKPDLCDFYLGSIVKKGDLKIGISTNGKSPTMAKRLKELLQDFLPDELDQTLQQMNRLRNSLQGSFAHKVQVLNKITESLLKEDKIRVNGSASDNFI